MSKTDLVSLIVTVLVLTSFIITFLSSYYLFYKEKKANLISGNVDKELDDEIHKDIQKYSKKEIAKKYTFKEVYLKKKKRTKIKDIIYLIVISIISLALISFISFTYINDKKNDLTFFNDKSVLVIQSESMSEANSYNDYLKNNSASEYKFINTRLELYSLIGVDKFNGDNIKLYDIVAFKGGNNILVHRLVKISVDETTGVTTYSFRGDANNASLEEEVGVTSDKILGIYNGFKSENLGYLVAFVQSEIGYAVIFLVAFTLIGYSIFNDKIDKLYDKRIIYILDSLKEANTITDYMSCLTEGL